MIQRVCIPGAVVIALVAAAIPASAQRPNCKDRDGRCIVLQVNGQMSVLLNKQRKTELEKMKAIYSGELRYELTTPLSGEIDVRADGVPGSQAWFGDLGEVDARIVPLQDVDLNTREELGTSSSVRAGGSAVVTQQTVLEGNRLPPGRYLLVVTLRGSANWDRQVAFFQVVQQ